MTPTEQKAFEQMRQALKDIAEESFDKGAVECANHAITAANAVSEPQVIQVMGLNVVLDPTMAPNEMRLVQPQAQGEAITLQRWGRAENLCLRLLDPMDDGYWTPWHIAQEAIDSLQKKIAFHPQATEPAGWTGKTDIDAALIMLDRLDVRGEGDDLRVDEISRTLRKLAAAPEAP